MDILGILLKLCGAGIIFVLAVIFTDFGDLPKTPRNWIRGVFELRE